MPNRLRGSFLVAALITAGSISADAAVTRTVKCQRAKLKAANVYSSCTAAAELKFLGSADTIGRDDALAACEAKLQKLWQKSIDKFGDAGCPSLWDDAMTETATDVCLADRMRGITTVADLRPVLDCVVRNLDGSLTAFFGYESSEPDTVVVPAGSTNGFGVAGSDLGQPTSFAPGVTANAFALAFHERATWNLAGRTATASRLSPPCVSQPAPANACEQELRDGLVATESSHDLFLAQLRSNYAAAIGQAQAGFQAVLAPPATPALRFPRAAGACSSITDQAVVQLGQVLAIASANATSTQNQLLTILNAVVAALPAAATSPAGGSASIARRAATAPAPSAAGLVAGADMTGDGFGNFEEWSATLLANFLAQTRQMETEFAAAVLEIAAESAASAAGIDAPTDAPFPFLAPRSITSDEIVTVHEGFAVTSLQALSNAMQNAAVSHQQLSSVALAALSDAVSDVAAGKRLDGAALAAAADVDRAVTPDPEIAAAVVPAVSAVDPEVAAEATNFLSLYQGNHRGFASALALLSAQDALARDRILTLFLAVRPTGSAMSAAAVSPAAIVVDPNAAPGDVALAQSLESLAQTTGIAMQNAVFAQQQLGATRRAELTQQLSEWLALP